MKCVSLNFLAMVNCIYPPQIRIATLIALDFDSALTDIRLQVPFILAVKLEERFDRLMFLLNNRALGPFNASKCS